MRPKTEKVNKLFLKFCGFSGKTISQVALSLNATARRNSGKDCNFQHIPHCHGEEEICVSTRYALFHSFMVCLSLTTLSCVSFMLTTFSRPQIAFEDQDTLLELLCSLLSPIGQYRSQHLQPSKGKRDKKRKRKEAEATDSHPMVPPAPELTSYVDAGLSAVTRSLENAAAKGRSLVITARSGNEAADEECDVLSYSVIFIARSGQPSILNSHLPQMVAVASATHPSKPPIRLVGLSRACEDRLSECLGIPRVSCIGIREDAPNSKALVDFARQHVPTIEVPWLEEAQKAEYKETKINTIQTTIGAKKQITRT